MAVSSVGGSPGRTLFDGVFQIPPGHYLTAGEKYMQVRQYWDFDYPRADRGVPQQSDADWAAEFRFTLAEPADPEALTVLTVFRR